VCPVVFDTFALNVAPVPMKVAALTFACSVRVPMFTFPMFTRTNSPFCAAHVPSPWLPSLFIVAPINPVFTTPEPKFRLSVVKLIAADVAMVTFTVALLVAYPVISVPMKKSEITIAAMAMYPTIVVALVFMIVLRRLVCLRSVVG